LGETLMTIETLYLVHHCHTDIGFTGDQPIIWELQARFITHALAQVERETEQFGAERASRWTIESAGVLEYWLRHATAREIDRLIAAERAGLVEVTAMFLNLTPLYDTVQHIEALQLVHRLRREYGFDIRSAMNCDVNGQNWPLADLLLDAGMDGFSMAINHHFGGPPEPRPAIFRWQAPSGRDLLAFNGWQYGKAGEFGLADDDEEKFLHWWPQVESFLAQTGYTLPVFMLQGIHPYGDNAGFSPKFGEFARRWNAAGRSPKIELATPRQWWQAVQPFREQMAVWRGDWTDYWNFGCISTAREVAIERATRDRLVGADAMFAALNSLPGAQAGWAQRSLLLFRQPAWETLNLWGEHTWSADGAGATWRDDARSQTNHKNHLAYRVHSYSQLLHRDALAEIARQVRGGSPDDLLVFNPLPWQRTISGAVSPLTLNPRGLAHDDLAGRHYQGHFSDPTEIGAHQSDEHFSLPPLSVPGFGYTVVPRVAILKTRAVTTTSESAQVENQRFRIVFNRERGGIVSLYDKHLQYEWVDDGSPYPFLMFVHEQVADRAHPFPRHLLNEMDWRTSVETVRAWKPNWRALRTIPERLLSHQVYHTPLGWSVEQAFCHPAVENLKIRLFLPAEDDFIECEAQWQMGLETHPEATYLVFPFNLPNATARFDVGGLSVRPQDDQLPGVNRDYFTTQKWVDFCDERRGVTIATPINPLCQLGDFHFAHNQGRFELPRATFLGWVTNNYWECNFPYHQPGTIVARYRIQPYDGAFDEIRAYRFGQETAFAQPACQHLGETADDKNLPTQEQFLQLPEGKIQTLQARALEAGKLSLRLLNITDSPQTAVIGSGIARIMRAWTCDLFNQPLSELTVSDGSLRLSIPPRCLQTVQLETTQIVSP
jgi:alpha-mannosidase